MSHDEFLDSFGEEANVVSERERLETSNEQYVNLLNSLMSRITEDNPLKTEIEHQLRSYFDPLDSDYDQKKQELSLTKLMKLYEIVVKAENDKTIGILNVIANRQKQSSAGLDQPLPYQGSSNKTKVKEVNPKQIQSAKKVLELVEELQDSEFSLDEITDLIRDKKKSDTVTNETPTT